MSDDSERERHLHAARVFLAQAQAFRRHSKFHTVLLTWAANERRRASGEPLLNQQAHAQGELFEGGNHAAKEGLRKGKHRPERKGRKGGRKAARAGARNRAQHGAHGGKEGGQTG